MTHAEILNQSPRYARAVEELESVLSELPLESRLVAQKALIDNLNIWFEIEGSPTIPRSTETPSPGQDPSPPTAAKANG